MKNDATRLDDRRAEKRAEAGSENRNSWQTHPTSFSGERRFLRAAQILTRPRHPSRLDQVPRHALRERGIPSGVVVTIDLPVVVPNIVFAHSHRVKEAIEDIQSRYGGFLLQRFEELLKVEARTLHFPRQRMVGQQESSLDFLSQLIALGHDGADLLESPVLLLQQHLARTQ